MKYAITFIIVVNIILLSCNNSGSIVDAKLRDNDIVGQWSIDNNRNKEELSNSYKLLSKYSNGKIEFYSNGKFAQKIGETRNGKWQYYPYDNNYHTSSLILRYDDGDSGIIENFNLLKHQNKFELKGLGYLKISKELFGNSGPYYNTSPIYIQH